MKILLINPPNQHLISAHVPDYVSDSSGYLPPLGLLSIGTYLKQNSDHQVKIFDALVEEADYEQVARQTLEADLVGITTITFYLMDVVKCVSAIHSINPQIPIILGGPHIAAFPKESLQIPGVTYTMTGECDQTFTQFVNTLANGDLKQLDAIPGLYRRVDDQIVGNPVDALIEDLDILPIPDRQLLDYKKYHSILSKEANSKGYVTTAFSSRGCPSKCTFCDRPHLGKNFRAHSAERVLEEIGVCISLGISEIFFYDDTFTIDQKRVRVICQGILDRGYKVKWDVRARVNTVDQELLELMKKAGCARIHFGVESGNQEILNKLRKGINKDQVREAFAHTRKAGIETLGYFMFGVPSETREQMLETLDFSLELNPNYANYAILTPFPATPLYLELLYNKQIPDDYWKEFAKNPDVDFIPCYSPNTLDQKQLLEILEKAHKDFYLRPSYLLKQTLKVKSFKDFLIKLKVVGRIIMPR